VRRRLVCGVDEAGRGPVLGPMVIAGVAMPEKKLALLLEIGVKDSKKLPAAKRLLLAEEVRRMASGVEVSVVEPATIDHYVSRRERLMKLNRLEAERAADLIKRLHARVAYVDSPDRNPARFGKTILSLVGGGVEVVSAHRADSTYPIVSAASIVAKTTRDALMQRLSEEHGALGSGYPSDPATRAFIRLCLQDGRELPWFVRKTWRTIGRLRSESDQKSLSEYLAAGSRHAAGKR